VRVALLDWLGVLLADGFDVALAVAMGLTTAVALGVAVVVGLGPGVSVEWVDVALAVAVRLAVGGTGGVRVAVALRVAVSEEAGVAVAVPPGVGVTAGLRMRNSATKSGALRTPSSLTSEVGQAVLPENTAKVRASMSAAFATPSQLTSPRTLATAAVGQAATATPNHATATSPRRARVGAGGLHSSPRSCLRMLDSARPRQPHCDCRWNEVEICDNDGALQSSARACLISPRQWRFAARRPPRGLRGQREK
jgi:hypothetical protein